MENSNLPPRRTRSTSRLVLFIFLVVCFVSSAVAGAMFASSSIFDGKKKTPVTVVERQRENKSEELIKATDKATILIMGVDIRHDDVGRSDTLMVATVDPKLDQASLLSIPRDTRVRIYGYGFDKINAAYAYGGEPLTEITVENFLGIDIDHYIIVNVHSFVKIIDAIGGVDIYVPKRMYYEDPWDDDGGLVIDLYPGRQHMDGKTAVTYVRYRDSEGDIGRVQRQQQFMAACLDKVTSPEIIPRIPEIIREVMYAVETDMSFRELLGLAGALKAAQANGLYTDMVPGYPLYIDEISYWIPYVDEIRYAMAEGLGVSVDSNMRRRFERDAHEYSDSIPDSAVEIPEGAENIGSARRKDSDSRRRSSFDSRESYNSRSDSTSDDDRYSTSESRTTADDRRTTSGDRYNYDNRSDDTTSRRYDERSSSENRTYDDRRESSTSDNYRRGESYPSDYQRDDTATRRLDDTTSRRYDDRSSSENRTDSDSRVYDDRRTSDSYRRDTTTDEAFDTPSRRN